MKTLFAAEIHRSGSFRALIICIVFLLSGAAHADAPLTYHGIFHQWGTLVTTAQCPDNQEETVVQQCVTAQMKLLNFSQTQNWGTDAFPCTGIDSSLECSLAGFAENGNPSDSYTGYVDLVCPNGGTPTLPSGQHKPGWCVLPGTVPACEPGQVRNPTNQECVSPGVRNAGCPKCKNQQDGSSAGDPINPAYGNTYETVTDYRGGGPFPLVFTRTYNSSIANETTSSGIPADEQVGKGWVSNLGLHMTHEMPLHQCPLPADSAYVCPMDGLFYTAWRADGSQDKFWVGNNTWPDCICGLFASGPTAQGMLSFNSFLTLGGAPFIYSRKDGYIESYDLTGRLIQIQDPHGLTQTYSYTFQTIGGVSLLRTIAVTDPTGRQMVLTYDTTNGRLQTLTIPADNGNNTTSTISYQYDVAGNLQYVTYPDDINPNGYTLEYRYDDTNYPHALTGIIDENNAGTTIEYKTWSYDSSTGKAICAALAGTAGVPCDTDSNAVEKVRVSYSGNVSTITEVTGLVRNLTYQTIDDVNVLHLVDRRCIDCGDISQEIDYDTSGQPDRTVDFLGHVDVPDYDDFGVENMLYEDVTGTLPNLGSYQRFTYSWLYQEPGIGETALPSLTQTYDGNGNLYSSVQYCYNSNNGTCVDTSTNPGIGKVWTVTYTDGQHQSLSARTITYTYSSAGFLKSVAGPRIISGNPVTTTFAFYTADSTSNGNGYKKNDVKSVTDARGNITTFDNYSPAGYVISATDPNGVNTNYQYDARQRLYSSYSVIPGTSTYRGKTYDHYANGLLQRVTFTDFPYYIFVYDTAHRLTSITDNDNNKITFTYSVDTNANTYTVEEKRLDSVGTVTYDHLRIRDDQYDRVLEKDGLGHITTYQLDANGNVTSITDPNNGTTSRSYDRLNRLQSITDAKVDVPTTFNLDTLDHVKDVTSPRGLDTQYDVDMFGDVLQVISPDTGTKTFTYDRGGNLTGWTDNASYSMAATYDELNRVLTKNFKNTAGTVTYGVTYSYDQTGSNGFTNIGYLTNITDPSGSTAYTYDAWGDVYQKTSVIGTVSFPVNYRYDTNGNLTNIWFGSTGAQIRYAYDNEQRISQVNAYNGSTGVSLYHLASSISYEPFGPVKGFTYGNSLIETRSYDPLTYQLSGIAVPSIYNRTFGHDASGNVSAIADVLNSANNQTFHYDANNQLVWAQGAYGTVSIGSDPLNHPELSYDPDGNRTQITVGGVTTLYGYINTTNQLQSLSGGVNATYGYNTFGNLNNDGTYKYSYDQTERMTTSKNASTNAVLGTYTYNALGQRVIKVASGTTTLFVYDEQGHLIAELGSTGSLLREHAWMGDRPLAWFGGDVSSTNARYIHTDQLDTPRVMTDSTGSVGWTWNSDPFGNGAPVLSGFGNTYRLRLPGQYSDSETGKNYNYFRDYDPNTGRYLESDPIGLFGGLNTFVYSNSNPTRNSDSSGLYVGFWHTLMTMQGGIDAGLSMSTASDLANAVADVDNGSQGAADAYMHNMCGPGLDTATCENMIYEYLNHQMDSCKKEGLARAIHVVQDGFASGHRNFQPYNGFFDSFALSPENGWDHLVGDLFPTDDELNIATKDTELLINKFQKDCHCSL